jgi:hypothetical protein
MLCSVRSRADGFSLPIRRLSVVFCSDFFWREKGWRSHPLYISCHPATHLLPEQQPLATVIGCCRLLRDLTPLRCGSEMPCPSSIWATHNRPHHLLPVVGGWLQKRCRGRQMKLPLLLLRDSLTTPSQLLISQPFLLLVAHNARGVRQRGGFESSFHHIVR